MFPTNCIFCLDTGIQCLYGCSPKKGPSVMDEMIKYLKALTFLQLQSMTGSSAFSKPELLLNRAGFTQKEIAGLLGKKESAVGMAIQRAKVAAAKEEQ